jgi:hypothetical protein
MIVTDIADMDKKRKKVYLDGEYAAFGTDIILRSVKSWGRMPTVSLMRRLYRRG